MNKLIFHCPAGYIALSIDCLEISWIFWAFPAFGLYITCVHLSTEQYGTLCPSSFNVATCTCTCVYTVYIMPDVYMYMYLHSPIQYHKVDLMLVRLHVYVEPHTNALSNPCPGPSELNSTAQCDQIPTL